MDPTRIDRLATFFADRRLSRRHAVRQGSAGLAAAGVAALGLRGAAAAQDATPPATPVGTPTDPHPSADTAGTHPEYLFVQPFDGGAWAPKPGEEGTYTLTLTGAAAQTAYFSDRPERIVGLAPTQTFLDGLGFTPENPPNAALVATPEGSDAQDILVIELLAPVYDAASGTLTYDARVLADYGGRGLAHLAQQQTDFEYPEAFGEGSLFIDDCPDSYNDGCFYQDPNNSDSYTYIGDVSSGNCWNGLVCKPCGSYSYVMQLDHSRSLATTTAWTISQSLRLSRLCP